MTDDKEYKIYNEFFKELMKKIEVYLLTERKWSESKAAFVVWSGLVGISLILIAIVTMLGINTRVAIESGAYWRWTVSIFLYGVIYLIFIWPGTLATIASAFLGSEENRVDTNGVPKVLWPKVASFKATLATGWVLAPITFLAVIPAYVIGAYYAGFMSAGTLAFLIFNRPNRGTFTKWIGCSISAVILIISVLLNVVPMTRILWSRHIGTTTTLPAWSNTLLAVALIATVVLGVLWATRKALGDNTIKLAITAFIVVALVYGATQAFGHGFSALAAYGRDYKDHTEENATATTPPSNQPLSVKEIGPNKWEVNYPSNQLKVDTGIKATYGKKVSVHTTGEWLNGKYGYSVRPEGIGGSPDTGNNPNPGIPMLASTVQVGDGPVYTAKSASFIADRDGNIILGTNDDITEDNSGTMTAIVEIH